MEQIEGNPTNHADPPEGFRLDGRIALVTGVSRQAGIGAAIVRALAKAGADLFITYYRPYDALMPWGSQPGDAAAILSGLPRGVSAAGLELDLSDPAAPGRLFGQVEAQLGPVDILVNNATHDQPAGLDDLEPTLLDRHYAVNVRGPLLLMREFARRYSPGKGPMPAGRIINLTSGQTLSPMPSNLPYAATKSAIEGLTLSLSDTLAGRGITVNAIDPGPTDTGWLSDEERSQLLAAAPFGRIGTTEDAARLVLFLASDQGRWITGQVIRSRGGF
jgi:3-oxoacyl-[acyl-carrier protein] reductase